MNGRTRRPPDFELQFTKRLRMAFQRIEAGEFRMGSRGEEYADEEPIHLVHITKPFYLGTFPVTQAQFAVWTKEQGVEHQNEFKNKFSHPAENLDWKQAKRFCQWINETYGSQLPTSYEASLPTEAQWEYACRAGTDTEYYTGDGAAALVNAGWFAENSDAATHPVGEKVPNAWGLYDIHGNVWEWCEDAWDEHAYKIRVDGVADPVVRAFDVGEKTPNRIVRGGSWNNSGEGCRSAIRYRWGPGVRAGSRGFRVCLVPGPVVGAETAA